MAKKVIKIDEKQIVIRRAKVREVKGLLEEASEKGQEVFIVFSMAQGKEITTFIGDSFTYISEKLQQFTDLKKEDIEELDMVDIVEVFKRLIEYNGISMGKLKSFFTEFIQPIMKPPNQEEQTIENNSQYTAPYPISSTIQS